MEEQAQNIEEVKAEDGIIPDEEIYFDPSSDAEYIASAFNALAAVGDIDTAIISKVDERRIRRIKRQALRIISHCLNNQYEELFDENSDDNGDD